MSDVSELFMLGVDLTNSKVDIKEIMKGRPTDRTVLLIVCRPNPMPPFPTSSKLEGIYSPQEWLRLYADGRLKDGAVIEEVFNIWLDTSQEPWQVRCEQKAGKVAVVAYIPEDLFWIVAARVETLYGCYITGKPILVRSADGSQYSLRDLMQMDTVLGMINSSLLARGIRLADAIR